MVTGEAWVLDMNDGMIGRTEDGILQSIDMVKGQRGECSNGGNLDGVAGHLLFTMI